MILMEPTGWRHVASAVVQLIATAVAAHLLFVSGVGGPECHRALPAALVDLHGRCGPFKAGVPLEIR